MSYQYLKGATGELGRNSLSGGTEIGQGEWLKLKEGRFRLDLRKKFFTQRVVRHWNRLPREAGDSPCLEVFKARLNEALGKLVWGKVAIR